MPEAIKAALTTELSIQHQSSSITEAPQELQYMPPGTHRINARRAGQPVSLDITVDPGTAETLNAFLQAQIAKAADGSDDRPFFDFNHEDREAAAWPIEFYWAGNDPITGGVRAKVEWSGAGKTAIEQKTFRTRRGGVDLVRVYREERSRSDFLAVDWTEDIKVTSSVCAKRITTT